MQGLNPDKRILLIGIGNDGRGDDALGWLFADRFSGNPALDVVYRYQLQIEDAALISEYDGVVFADASLAEIAGGFEVKECTPAASVHFSTHRLEPATILWLAKAVYQASTVGFVVAIQGYAWELHQGLSPSAALNLEKAVGYAEDQALLKIGADLEQI